MITAIVHDHVGSRSHVAVVTGNHAIGMAMVRRGGEYFGKVAGGAYVARYGTGFQCRRMRIVAIAAGDACPVHPALNERTVDVNFFPDLAIREVEILFQEARQMCVEERFAELVTVPRGRAPT